MMSISFQTRTHEESTKTNHHSKRLTGDAASQKNARHRTFLLNCRFLQRFAKENPMTRLALIGMLAAYVVIAAADVAAAPLAATKPSQLVSAFGILGSVLPGTPCPGIANSLQPGLLTRADGTNVPFAIPPKSVLIVTSIDFQISEATPNQLFTVSTFAKVPNTDATTFGSIVVAGAVADSVGRAAGTIEIPSGLAIKPPAVPCTAPSSGSPSSVVLHGFFAKDK